jgi:hypothetical protein
MGRLTRVLENYKYFRVSYSSVAKITGVKKMDSKIENRIKIASETILEMCGWDTNDVSKKKEVERYLRGFLLKEM